MSSLCSKEVLTTAMPTYKTTWFFEGLQPNLGSTASSVVSWSETWYQTAASVDAALANAISTTPNTWLLKRIAFLHALYAVKWCRVSNDADPRQTKLASIGAANRGPIGYVEGGGQTPYNPATAAQVNCCALADLAVLPRDGDTKTHHRRILLRGLPQSMINGNTINELGAGYNGLLSFLNYVGRARSPNFPQAGAAPTWLIRFQSPLQLFQPIGTLAVAANLRGLTMSAPLPAAVNGSRIEIRGVVSPQRVNKIWTVRSLAPVAAGGPYNLVRTKFDIVGAWDNTGSANLIIPAYAPADQYTLIGLRTKHTGSSPFGRTRGRRRAR
jgi:hypothetical protein